MTPNLVHASICFRFKCILRACSPLRQTSNSKPCEFIEVKVGENIECIKSSIEVYFGPTNDGTHLYIIHTHQGMYWRQAIK